MMNNRERINVAAQALRAAVNHDPEWGQLNRSLAIAAPEEVDGILLAMGKRRECLITNAISQYEPDFADAVQCRLRTFFGS